MGLCCSFYLSQIEVLRDYASLISTMRLTVIFVFFRTFLNGNILRNVDEIGLASMHQYARVKLKSAEPRQRHIYCGSYVGLRS
jgi:hypothetical protein